MNDVTTERAIRAAREGAAAPAALAHEWHQSTIAQYLRCPRQWRLAHVDHVRPDHGATGWAAAIGSAVHAGVALLLSRPLDSGRSRSPDALAECVGRAFADAVARAAGEGATHDDETVGAALDLLLEQWVPDLLRLAADPRVAAVDWLGVEAPFAFADPAGRRYAGTVDAWGVVRDERPWREQELTTHDDGVHEGDVVIVDWKSGESLDLSRPARALQVQLAYYEAGLAENVHLYQRVHLYLGALRDLRPYVRPRDEGGASIPETLRALNPAWLAALELEADSAAARSSTRRPKGPDGAQIPKWQERPNPAYAAATSGPRGPVFHRCSVDRQLASEAIRDAIRGAEAGLFPASGAINGHCGRCPYRHACVERGQ